MRGQWTEREGETAALMRDAADEKEEEGEGEKNTPNGTKRRRKGKIIRTKELRT